MARPAMLLMREVAKAATPATLLISNALARYIGRYTVATGRYKSKVRFDEVRSLIIRNTTLAAASRSFRPKTLDKTKTLWANAM